MKKIIYLLATLACSGSAWAADTTAVIDSGDTAWILVSTLLVLMMTIPGLALFYGGMVRKKNVLATMGHSFSAAAMVTVVWVIVGYSLAFGDGGLWLGDMSKLLLEGITTDTLSGTIPEVLFAIFQMTFAIIAVAIISGSVADRIKFSAWIVYMGLWVLVV